MIAAGAAYLETTANAYTSSFGDPRTAVQRLNLAQAFNGLGACLAPVIGAMLIFSGVEHSAAIVEAMSPSALAAYRASEAVTVQLPYTLLALAALLVAGALMLSSFFMSIMFPTIFALGVGGTEPAKPLGSAFIITAIIGGAIFPPLTGMVAVRAGEVPIAMLLPLVCFAAIAVYAWRITPEATHPA